MLSLQFVFISPHDITNTTGRKDAESCSLHHTERSAVFCTPQPAEHAATLTPISNLPEAYDSGKMNVTAR